MAQMFEDEKKFPDNSSRANFVFLGYPHKPPLALDDYRSVTRELEQELPIRLWYFLDEVTTQEMMRKVWRAILRSNLCFFDISGGNPNVALELGMAVAINKPCLTLLKTGEANPLGDADMSYAERAEYQSRETLKTKLRELLRTKCAAMRILNEVSYQIQSAQFPYARDEIERRLAQAVSQVFLAKRTTRAAMAKVFGSDEAAGTVLNAFRERGVFKLEGQRRAAKWLLGDSWVHHDHEVVGA